MLQRGSQVGPNRPRMISDVDSDLRIEITNEVGQVELPNLQACRSSLRIVSRNGNRRIATTIMDYAG
jgi:hypothetical protein